LSGLYCRQLLEAWYFFKAINPASRRRVAAHVKQPEICWSPFESPLSQPLEKLTLRARGYVLGDQKKRLAEKSGSAFDLSA